MASFNVEDFVGNGSLRELIPKLIDEGWDDIPTLKLMSSEDMDDLGMTQQQKDALEIRSYLHDRSLMQYGDQLEASSKGLDELLNFGNTNLSSQFGMKRGHIARFMDRMNACAGNSSPLKRRYSLPSRNNSIYKSELSSLNSRKFKSLSSKSYHFSLEQSMASFKIKDGHVYKGIVAAMPSESIACNCIQPPPIVENVAPYSIIEKIYVEKLAPEYKMIGMERLIKTKTPPMKASELWREKPAVLLCLRRPGYETLCDSVKSA